MRVAKDSVDRILEKEAVVVDFANVEEARRFVADAIVLGADCELIADNDSK
jgi:hypothetical protein